MLGSLLAKEDVVVGEEQREKKEWVRTKSSIDPLGCDEIEIEIQNSDSRFGKEEKAQLA